MADAGTMIVDFLKQSRDSRKVFRKTISDTVHATLT